MLARKQGEFPAPISFYFGFREERVACHDERRKIRGGATLADDAAGGGRRKPEEVGERAGGELFG